MKRLGHILVWLAIVLLLAPVAIPPFLDRIYYRGGESAHFDGVRFFNRDGETMGHVSPRIMARFFLGSGRAEWPKSVAVSPDHPPAKVDGQAMRVTWVGHSTVLVQTDGLNILTDPIWSDRAGPFGIFGPKRVTVPGISFDDLPKIDLVLVSHDHYDHMDLATLKRLWARDKPLIVTSLGNDAILRGAGVEAVARDWHGRVPVKPGVDVIVERVHHWGSRWGSDRDRALWSGFTVTLPGGNLFFAGDTGWGDGSWPVEAAKDGPYRFAILPIGAFQPRSMMQGNHIGPIEAVAAFERLNPAYAMAVHWGTFQLSSEGRDEPPHLLAATLAKDRIAPDRFRALPVGGAWMVPASSPLSTTK